MSEKRYRVGSERTYRIVKRGATADKLVLYEGEVPAYSISIADHDRPNDYTLELVKDFDVVEPVTADDAVRLARHWATSRCSRLNACACVGCNIARSILERAGAK